jgi:pyruvate, orthophosphate dikinase
VAIVRPAWEDPIMTKRRWCFHFGRRTDGRADMKDLLGGKGANLAEMTRIGLPVPPGFTISTEACAAYAEGKGTLPRGLMDEVRDHVAMVEKETGKTFGRGDDPLLLSVRSGAKISMPGMMDTVLDLGLNAEIVTALERVSESPRFAWDAYRRLIQMFGDVVLGIPHRAFEEAFDAVKKRHRASQDTAVPVAGLRLLVSRYEKLVRRRAGREFPSDPWEQLRMAIEGVLASWNKPSAVTYRRIHRIEGLPGTAVNVQSMVYGNLGPDSGSGVAFTRNPSTGEDVLYGEYLESAQGEDVVAGIRTPLSLSALSETSPGLHAELEAVRRTLERHFGDMQDFEFTVERGKLYVLQTRTGKRTGAAAVRIAVEMAEKRKIDRDTAVARVPAEHVPQLLLPSFAPEDKEQAERLAIGLPASPGAAAGKLAFSASEAVARALDGEPVLLVRRETSPEDVDGMHHAQGIVTSTGGMTSHAAVVARGWGKCCVVGATALAIDETRGTVTVGDRVLGRDDLVSIDGATGEILLGEVQRTPPTGVTGLFAKLLDWADARARLEVHANADTHEDAARARSLGAKGIGLCRTEHMFFGERRIAAMRRMILADTTQQRKKALRALLPHQRKDFAAIFRAMSGLPVTIRLLDPPLHEFLPTSKVAREELAKSLGIPTRLVDRRVAALHEQNPMLGHRGCRLAVSFPEIAEMQVTAIAEAAIACRREKIDARPAIMIPLVGMRGELALLRERAEATIAEVKKREGFRGKLDIAIGTMIEIPRAALVAGAIAEVADFFSFGTNDLTQLTFGFSRDDIGSFLPKYLDTRLLARDPFQSIDVFGVGSLVRTAVEKGRASRPDLGLGVCGEHGGDPHSVAFFHGAGLDYVSCSPFRVPVARLAAAQAALA